MALTHAIDFLQRVTSMSELPIGRERGARIAPIFVKTARKS